MKPTYRLGIIGYAHSHILSNAPSFSKLGERVSFVASADNQPLVQPINDSKGTRVGIRRDVEARLAIPHIYDDWRAMLREQRLDIVLMCADNAMHPEIGEAILRTGAHVVLEKPMCVTTQGALRMARAAREGGGRIIVNWPSTWNPAVRLAHKLTQEGAVGRVFKLTYRNSESLGPLMYGQVITDVEKGYEWWHQSAPGGGALLDYCCYGACLSRWFIGQKAVAAYGMKANFNSPYGDAEDYATITARFPEAVAILEGSWTSVSSGIPHGPIVYGLDGTLVVDADQVKLYKTRHGMTPDEVYDAPALPQGRASLGEEVLHCLDSGEPLHETLDLPLNIDAQAILDAGIRSAASGKVELVTDQTWAIG